MDYLSTQLNPFCHNKLMQGQSTNSNFKVGNLLTTSSGKQSQSYGSLLDSSKKHAKQVEISRFAEPVVA